MDVQKTLDTYASLMETVKLRYGLLFEILTKPSTLPDWAIAEIAQQQIRGICEAIAIACLVAHRDLEGAQSRRLTDAYQADFIMNALEKMNPLFYPIPSKPIANNGIVVGWSPIKEGFLTKAELVKSYRDTGDFLHHRNLGDLLSGKPRVFDIGATMVWANKLLALLDHHHIYLADAPGQELGFDPHGTPIPRRQIVVLMHDSTDGKPHARLFEASIAPRPEA
jgi:hypothetical protein